MPVSKPMILLAGLLAGCATSELPDIEPVSYESGANSIRLEVVGRYSLGFFDIGAAAPAAYDPETRRLFVLSVDRGWLDTLDIDDPTKPRRLQRKQLLGYGGQPTSIGLRNGILAVTLKSPIKTLPGKVLFFDVDGARLGGTPPRTGAKPNHLRFTRGGEVVIANQGEANGNYTVDPRGSVTIVDLNLATPDCRGSQCLIEEEVVQLDFAAYDDRADALRAAGVRIYGPGASVAEDLEPEAVAVSPDGRTAFVSLQRNNALAIIDLPGRTVLDIVAFGTKDHSRPENGLDASDMDGAINIRPWPLRSFYHVDLLDAYEVGGQVFLVTPNEGDPRDFDGFSEVLRVRDLSLDPAAFPNAADLQRDENLGRLRVTNVDGDADGDGDFEQIFMLGSRSFATWTGAGRLVFDSGDTLERIIAEALPACFNCSDSSIGFDGQSDTRGPEPETVAIGEIAGRYYAFIAPERIGGIYAYDVTDPAAPVFQHYINFRDFSVDPSQVCEEARPLSEGCAQAGDLGPEGVLFMAAADSPLGVPMLAVSHELSTSTTLFRIDPAN